MSSASRISAMIPTVRLTIVTVLTVPMICVRASSMVMPATLTTSSSIILQDMTLLIENAIVRIINMKILMVTIMETFL